MSARQHRILTLMARQENRELGHLSMQLGHLRSREMQQFDMADRLGQMLDQSAQAPSQPMTPGQLSTAHFMGRTLVQQLEATRSQMARTREQRAALEQDLSQHQRRQQILQERADLSRRAQLQARADAQDNAALPRRTR
ncbi:protein subunit release factor B [Roseovarius sp. MBR-51]